LKVQLVQAFASGEALLHHLVYLLAGQVFLEHGAYSFGPSLNLGRVVAFVADCKEVITNSQCKDYLGGTGYKGADPHSFVRSLPCSESWII